MSPTRSERVEALFIGALETPPEQWVPYLAAATVDPEVRGEVLSLLLAHEGRGRFDSIADRLHGLRPAAASVALATVVDQLRTALAERYRIERELGRGGMATVYLAQDLKHHRQVALKVLNPELAAVLGRNRFPREIEIAAHLTHPHIVPLYDSGEAAGFLYYAMPYIAGESLRDRLKREQQLPLEEALRIAREVADGLTVAHRHGLVHCDVKPENILLEEGHAVISDFGIARAITEAGGDRLTATGMAVGTPTYMSPEQATGTATLDGRSDLYALGCVLYEMLAGRSPFTGEFAQEVIAKHATEPAPSLRTIRDVPSRVERVIHRCLAKTPDLRYPSGAELQDDLAACQAELSARRLGLGVLFRRPAAVGALVVVGVSIVSAGAWTWLRQSRAHWARTVALPQASRLVGEGRTYAAFRLLRQAERYVPDDPILKELLVESTYPVTVRTTPAGARVYTRDFFDQPNAWELVGSTPLSARLPSANLVWKISRDGFQTRELLAFTLQRNFDFSLQPVAVTPADMVPVDGGPYELFNTTVELADFWIDKYEVTNRQFREFVERRGYEQPSYWTTPIVKDGVMLTGSEAQRVFRDRTGRFGPGTWELGTYPDGQGDYPVGGVSWYEAAAYCASVGKQLPTVFHWYQAAQLQGTSEYTQFGNFEAEGPARVGRPLRLGSYGTYDMAGNVKEWTWNEATPSRHYILGGGWNEPSYQFSFPDAQGPWSREATFGIRCAKYRAPPPPSQLARIVQPFRDYRHEKPVGDALFAAYESPYNYDRTPLAPSVDSVRERFEHWTVEHVSFAAAYGNERVPAWLFLPKNAHPPYQVVVYFPGVGPWLQQSSPREAWEGAGWFLSLIRSGRAVLFPVYKGMYERHAGSIFLPNIWRDLIIQSAKDLRRSVDYLETRPDIDAQRLAYFGISSGAMVGPIMTAVEPRFKASILLGGGLYSWQRPPESDPFNFLPRVKVPTLMINGRHDFSLPLETSQAPMFRLLGAPADKRHRVFESGHVPTERQDVMKEILDWLDRYLGPVMKP